MFETSPVDFRSLLSNTCLCVLNKVIWMWWRGLALSDTVRLDLWCIYSAWRQLNVPVNYLIGLVA